VPGSFALAGQEPGVSVCRVAIRHRQHGVDDLLPAHLRVRERAG